MPRRLVKQFGRLIHARRHKWYLSMFGERIAQSHLWSLNRRSITIGFGVGIGVSFIPLPVHLVLVVLAALTWRLNLAVAMAGTYIVNPLTMVPIYYAAYRVGAWVLRYRPRRFEFHANWNWLEHGLGPAWKPFLLGCLICGVAGGFAGRYALEFVLRLATLRRYRSRQQRRRACQVVPIKSPVDASHRR